MVNSRLLIALLLAAALVGQVSAQQHVHADDLSASCLVCAHGDTTAAVNSPQNSTLAIYASIELIPAEAVSFDNATGTAPRVRGPPVLQLD